MSGLTDTVTSTKPHNKTDEILKAKIKKKRALDTKMGFIAGPYFGDGTYTIIEKNIREAERVAIELANRQIFFFCPHTHTRHFEAKAGAPEEYYKAMDIHHLLNCDFLVALPRWKESSGARKEIRIFRTKGKPIFYLHSLEDGDTYDKIEVYSKRGIR